MKNINNTSNVLGRLFGSLLVIAAITSVSLPAIALADAPCGETWSASAQDYVSDCNTDYTPYVAPTLGTYTDYTIDTSVPTDYPYYTTDNSYNDYSSNSYDDSSNWYSFGLNLTYNDTDIKNQTNNYGYGYSSPNYGYTYNDTPYNYGDYHGSNVTYIYDNTGYNYGDYHSPKPAPTCSINVNDSSVSDGDSVTLTWSSNNATSASLSNAGTVATSGSRTVTVNGDTTYVLSVSGAGGSATCGVNVNVNTTHNVAAPSCNLEVSDDNITEGDSTILRWYVTGNADSASINQGIGSVGVGSGSERISPDTDTTYRMTVRGEGGSRTCSATVNVDPSNQNNVSLNITPVNNVPTQPYTSVYLADAPYTGAGDTAAVVGSILALVAGAAALGYFLFMKGLPFAFKRAAVQNAPVATSETTKKTTAKTIRVGGIDQNEVYAFMNAYAANDTHTMQSIRAEIKARGIGEERLGARVSSAANDALTARKFGGATENALLTIDEATLTALAA